MIEPTQIVGKQELLLRLEDDIALSLSRAMLTSKVFPVGPEGSFRMTFVMFDP